MDHGLSEEQSPVPARETMPEEVTQARVAPSSNLSVRLRTERCWNMLYYTTSTVLGIGPASGGGILDFQSFARLPVCQFHASKYYN